MGTAPPGDSDITTEFSTEPLTTDHNSSITSILGETSVDLKTWQMSRPLFVVSLTLVSVETGLALLSNALLITTIRYSPTLRTPPNNQLISICVNNLLVVFNMILGLWSLNIPAESSVAYSTMLKVLSILQMLLTSISWLQYWCIFCAIGFYRSTTLRRPSMSVRNRKAIIYRSIWVGWLLSTSLGTILTISFHDTKAAITWNPFRQSISFDGLDVHSFPQNVAIFLALCGFLIGLAILLGSYYRIFKTLYRAVDRPVFTNRVHPMTRNPSLSTDDNDLMVAVKSNYRPSDGLATAPTPFAITGGAFTDNNLTVHFHRKQQSVTMDVLALENPLRVRSFEKVVQQHGALQESLRAGANASNLRPPHEDFSDISPAAEIQRVQMFTTNSALWSHSLRRDRISLGGATKNCLVMMLTYIILSFPMVICTIPGILNSQKVDTITLPILFCKLLFYFNSPAYPIFYLVFSRRVRKCLRRLLSLTKTRLWNKA